MSNTIEQDEMYKQIFYKYIQPFATRQVVNASVTQAQGKVQKEKKEKKVASYMQQNQPVVEQELPLDEAIRIKQNFQLMDNQYEPRKVEKYWYNWWEQKKYFRGDEQKGKNLPDNKKYIMVVPPPNVTGYLHIGHGITAAIEDSLCRWKRMQGYVTEYLPGTDHAGIATQSVVEKKLWKDEGKTRHDYTREQFLEKVWEWKESHGNGILQQFKRLGVSMDWDRLVFTMDEKLSVAVKETFVRLYEQGLIYRANRLVNWSCKMKTALSDVEVEFMDVEKPTYMSVPNHNGKYEFGVLHKFAYKVKGSDEEIIVATTRLETMLGDVAVAVHSGDERYKHLIGKELVHPFFEDRKVIVIADDILVDPAFGTGAVKITPGHDPNDYECGIRNKLPQINIFNDDGQINQNGGQYKGLMRYDARVKLIQDLEKLGLLRGKEPNKMRIGLCYRSKDIIEPLLRPQWYVNCQTIQQKMIQIVKDKELRILPEEYEKNWFSWFENLKDWCISRQIWWGHRCPAYKILIKGDANEEENWVVGRNLEEALANAEKKTGLDRSKFELQQDEDVLDTWFSSALFPFSPFGWPNEESEDFKAFFPNTILETGHDILFFWVARMVMMSSLLIGKLPFKTVFLHPIIRDSQGRKMSKSLGNVVDPLEIIDGTSLENLINKITQGNLDPKEQKQALDGKKKEYPEGIPECGSDALRFGLLSYMIQGRNINLDIKRIIAWRQFCNKIWNSFKFVLQKFQPDFVYDINSINFQKLSLMDQWILVRLNKTIAEVNQSFEIYRFGEASSAFYQFWMKDFCDIYIEASKFVFLSNNQQEIHNSQTILFNILDQGLRLLHPMMPFLTEELYQKLPQFKGKFESICIAEYPIANNDWKNEQAEKDKETIFQIIETIRSLQASVQLPPSARAEAFVFLTEKNQKVVELIEQQNVIIVGLAKIKSIVVIDDETKVQQGCIVGLPNTQIKIFLSVKEFINIEAEIAKLEKKLANAETQIDNYLKKMAQKDYDIKTPEKIKNANLEKLEEYQKEKSQLLKSINDMKQSK